ncbi:MAG: hypothetical protein ACYDA8_00565 [Deferrisomatales bacterium]
MKRSRWVFLASPLFVLALGVLGASATTIAPGEVRAVEGTVTAVDLAHRSVVLDVATAKGPLTVGATLAPDAGLRSSKGPVDLGAVSVGDRARLRYTREDGRLVGLELMLRR